MNDTETRLRDYLQAKASTVPDTAQGPGLEVADSPSARRHWPAVLAAAAIAAILALTATFLTRNSDQPTPAGPVSDAPPRVPYTVYQGPVLHDGDQKVRIPSGVDAFFFGRADGGWLGMKMPANGESQAGILRPDGSFRTLGPKGADGTTLSPDRKQVAVMQSLSGAEGQIVVIDIDSGREALSPALPVRGSILGWNQNGIWFRTDDTGGSELFVWEPGSSGQPTHVEVADFDGGLNVAPATDTIALTTRAGDARCVKVGVLRKDGFTVQRQSCDEGPQALYPVMSPDGRTVVNSQRKLVVDLPTGKVTRLQLPAQDEVTVFPQVVFEDATNLLVITTPPGNQLKPVDQQIYRCEVRTGECKVVQKGTGITLHQP